MRKNLLKRYNDFIKINENQETEAPVKPDTAPTETPTPTETPDKRRERYTIPTPSVNPDPNAEAEDNSNDTLEVSEEGVEDNLEYLHDTLEGSELMNNILKYQGHEITLPSETGEFEVDGVRKIKKEGTKLVPTSSAEDVIEYLNNPEAQSEAQAKQGRRIQAQAQRAQAQVQAKRESLDFNPEDTIETETEELPADQNLPAEDEAPKFETQTGQDPEAEARSGVEVDVEETGVRNESKSYRNRFRTKL